MPMAAVHPNATDMFWAICIITIVPRPECILVWIPLLVLKHQFGMTNRHFCGFDRVSWKMKGQKSST